MLQTVRMRDYGLMAHSQRFTSTISATAALRHNNTVLAHCREGANRSRLRGVYD